MRKMKYFDEGGGASGDGGDSGDSGDSTGVNTFSDQSPADVGGLQGLYAALGAPEAPVARPSDKALTFGNYGALPSNVKPGEEKMASDAAQEYAAKLTPEQMHKFALTLGVRSDPAWSYNFNNPGLTEKIMDAMYIAPNSTLYKWGMRTPGVSAEQMRETETPEEKDTRMKNVSGALNNIINLAPSLTPFGPAFNAIKTATDVASGKATPGGAITNVIMSLAASKLGIPSSALSSALAGDMGGVAKSMALNAVSSELSKNTGVSPSLVNFGLNATGANTAIGNTIRDTVNSALPNTSTGITKGAISNAVDRFIGATPAGPGSLNSMDSLNPSQDTLMGTPTPTGAMRSPSVPLSSLSNILFGAPSTSVAAAPATADTSAPEGSMLKLGQTGGGRWTPYSSGLSQFAVPAPKRYGLNQSMTSSDAEKLLSLLDQNAPTFAKEGGSIQHFAGGGSTGGYDSKKPSGLGDMFDSIMGGVGDINKNTDDEIKTLETQSPAGMGTYGGMLPVGQAAYIPQRALRQMSVVPELAALLQARGMHLPLRMAQGGTPDHEHPNYDGTPVFRSGGLEGLGGKYVEGKGDGTSDDITAMLANGEYVFSADVVSALGNGSNKAGAKELDNMVQAIRARARSAPPDKLPPDAKPPLEYLKSSKGTKHG